MISMVRRILIAPTVLLLAFTLSGCSFVTDLFTGAGKVIGLTDGGTVITRRAQIRSSYAVVAADLLEVKRGDRLVILDELDFEKVRWLRVRAYDEDQTEGWIEAQNVITDDILSKSEELATEDEGRVSQAVGQLRARSNLRLAPQLEDSNILFKLDGDSVFEILSWKYVPRQKDASDIDDGSARSRSASSSEEAGLTSAGNKLEEKYDIWYKVRLDPKYSPAPAGWLFGRQVGLLIPNDIIFYQQDNRRFVAWQRLDGQVIKDNSKVTAPGSYVILTHSGVSKSIGGDEPDFDGITVLAYDKFDQVHYTVYRSSINIWGKLPLVLEGTGDSRTFTVSLRNFSTDRMESRRFVIYRDGERLRVTAPDDMKTFERKF
jgi:hypothetical protein